MKHKGRTEKYRNCLYCEQMIDTENSLFPAPLLSPQVIHPSLIATLPNALARKYPNDAITFSFTVGKLPATSARIRIAPHAQQKRGRVYFFRKEREY